MNAALRVMLLIDADNAAPEIIEQSLQRTLKKHGSVHVRRAYCNADTALKQQALFKRLSVRPMVNVSTGKNSTDIALCVDAMELVMTERPTTVVLVSSDSDYAPLVLRLREKGCHVCGFGQQGQTGDETALVYDEFIVLEHKSSKTGKKAAKKAAKKTDKNAGKSADKSVEPSFASAPAPDWFEPDSDPVQLSLEPLPLPLPVPLPDERLLNILAALPGLRDDEGLALNQAAASLRAAKLLGRNASSLKLFRKFPEIFRLDPLEKPEKVYYTGPDPA